MTFHSGTCHLFPASKLLAAFWDSSFKAKLKYHLLKEAFQASSLFPKPLHVFQQHPLYVMTGNMSVYSFSSRCELIEDTVAFQG